MPPVVLVLVAFVLMEPVAYLTHRFVMHGRLGGWHRSHHQMRVQTLEANDLYPVVGAAISIVIIALGTAVDSLASLAWVGAGITLYGAATCSCTTSTSIAASRRSRGGGVRSSGCEKRTGSTISGPASPSGSSSRSCPPSYASAATVSRDPLQHYGGLLPGGH